MRIHVKILETLLFLNNNKKQIKVFREENDINPEAVKNFFALLFFYISPYLFFFVIIVLLFISSHIHYLAIASILLAIIIIFYANVVWNIYYWPYMGNSIYDGEIFSLGYAINSDITAYVKHSYEQLTYEIHLTLLHDKKYVRKGTNVKFLTHGYKYGVLTDELNMQRFCLQKSKITKGNQSGE